jgi:hypothetical protein
MNIIKIPYDKPHILGDDGNVHPLLLAAKTFLN